MLCKIAACSIKPDGPIREDLYFRLFVFPIYIPPLRERVQDIPALIHFFIQRICDRLNISSPPVLHPGSLPRLSAYSWPGNIRELENLVERAVILSSGDVITPEKYLPRDAGWYIRPGDEKGYLEKLIDQRIEAWSEDHPQFKFDSAEDAPGLPAKDTREGRLPVKPLDDLVREGIEHALRSCSGRISGPHGAAAALRINASTLRNKMARLGINPSDWRPAR